jgi:hypothetical protein
VERAVACAQRLESYHAFVFVIWMNEGVGEEDAGEDVLSSSTAEMSVSQSGHQQSNETTQLQHSRL